MDEYISRKAAIEGLSAEALERNLDSVMTDDAHRYHRAAERIIAGVPAADVRPVVLCKDCEHSEPWYSDKSRCFLWNESGIDVFNDGFCSYGRKEAET